MLKKKNQEKKALTAVGAVVAAGLTPGFIAVSAAGSSIQSPISGVTAAEVVAINGQAYSFDELYAMQQPDSAKMNTNEIGPIAFATEYGAPIVHPYKNNKDDESVIYRSVEQMPQFPGGEAALMKYIQSHINYPPMAAENKVKGRVIVQFVVDETGKVGEVKVVRSVDEYLDREAVRVCKSLPKFTPGRQNGQAVSVWYTLPVTFTMTKEPNTTAADSVVIDGKTYSFEELYAKQRAESGNGDVYLPEVLVQTYPTTTKYGGPWMLRGSGKNNGYPSGKVNLKTEPNKSVEQMPRFPGGEAALMKYINAHTNYPPEAAKAGIEGRVVLQFVVEKTGEVGEVKVVRSLDKYLDKEAVRVVKSLPKFTPGRQNGQAVSVWYTLPVSFKAPNKE